MDTSVASINSAVQRARATLSALSDGFPSGSADLTDSQKRMLNRYVAAFEGYDVDALTSLMREDVTLSMPPYALWFQGREAIRSWMLGLGCGCRGSRLVPIAACGSPAFGQYRVDPDGGFKAWAVIVLELSGDQITAVNSFLDVENLFPRFELPLMLPA
jgi:RNA polymerase sigma-70 factor (ECF subfamily)